MMIMGRTYGCFEGRTCVSFSDKYVDLCRDNGKKTIQEEHSALPIDSLFPPGRDPKYLSTQLMKNLYLKISDCRKNGSEEWLIDFSIILF
jgi:hypothetical protein